MHNGSKHCCLAVSYLVVLNGSLHHCTACKGVQAKNGLGWNESVAWCATIGGCVGFCYEWGPGRCRPIAHWEQYPQKPFETDAGFFSITNAGLDANLPWDCPLDKKNRFGTDFSFLNASTSTGGSSGGGVRDTNA